MDDETSKVLLRGMQEVGALLVKIGETMLNCAREARGPSTATAVAAPEPGAAAASLPTVQTQSHANPPASSAPSKAASSRGRPSKRSSALGAAISKASTTAQGQATVAAAAPGTKPSAKSSVARPSRSASAQATGSSGRGRGSTAKRVPINTSLPTESSAAAKARGAAVAATTTTSAGKRASLTKGKSPARSELPRKDARQPQRREDDDDDDDDDESSDSSEGPAVETKRRAQPAQSFEDGSDDDGEEEEEDDDDTSATGSCDPQGKPAEGAEHQEDLYEDVELENDSSDSDSTDDDLLDDTPVKRLLTKNARTSASAIATKAPAARGRKRKVAEPSPRHEQAAIDEDIIDGGTASVANVEGNPNGKPAVPRQSSSSKRQGSLAAKDGTAPPTTKRKRVTWTPEKDALIIRVVRENPNGSEALVMREMADVFGEEISQYQTKARFRNLVANGILKKRKPRGFVVAEDDDNQSQDNDSEKSTPELSHIPATESPPRKPSVSAARIQKEPAKTSARIRSATRAQ